MRSQLDRRTFLKQTAGAAFLGLAGPGPLLKGCSSKKDFDLTINNGLIFDGTGGRPFEADIGIAHESIVFIGKIKNGRARKVIDAKNLAVSPGFVDVHDHTDVSLLVNPKAESVVHQGITSLISGNCGSSPFPFAQATWEEERENLKNVYGLELDWRDIHGFFRRLQQSRMAVNYATLVGHGSIRAAVMGLEDRPPHAEEMTKMAQEVRNHLQAGAFGLSTGLEYAPGSFANPDEITTLCRAVHQLDGVYATHMRDEGDYLLEAIDESIRVARETRVKLQISHFKVAYPRNWSKVDEALAMVERAKQEGVDIFCDRYPYIACSTGLSFYFPMWSKEGTTEDFVRRLRDPSLQEKLKAYVAEQEKKIGSWGKVVLSSIISEKNRHFQGQTILEAAASRGKDAYTFMRDLLIEERGQVDMIAFIMNEENLKKILAHPLVGVGCDGSAVAPYGPLSLGKPHPRNYGTFPRVLGKYVREEKVCSLESMIKKMTSLPASRFGLRKRGIIEVGAFADLVVFDPARVIDRATWVNPHQYPEGIEYVIVNGQVVIEAGDHTNNLPGKILKKRI